MPTRDATAWHPVAGDPPLDGLLVDLDPLSDHRAGQAPCRQGVPQALVRHGHLLTARDVSLGQDVSLRPDNAVTASPARHASFAAPHT